jgi:hypothetical protein
MAPPPALLPFQSVPEAVPVVVHQESEGREHVCPARLKGGGSRGIDKGSETVKEGKAQGMAKHGKQE